jgi:hypothetical protein
MDDTLPGVIPGENLSPEGHIFFKALINRKRIRPGKDFKSHLALKKRDCQQGP